MADRHCGWTLCLCLVACLPFACWDTHTYMYIWFHHHQHACVACARGGLISSHLFCTHTSQAPVSVSHSRQWRDLFILCQILTFLQFLDMTQTQDALLPMPHHYHPFCMWDIWFVGLGLALPAHTACTHTTHMPHACLLPF